MSNINREQLEEIFNTYHIVFLNIQKEAARLNVDFDIDINEDGYIKLSARDDTSCEGVTRWYEVSQNKNSVRYEETCIKNNK